MSDLATTPPGFALRGADLKESARVFKIVDDLERERRIRRLVTIGGGWIMATLMTGVAVACLGVMWVRPVPQDRHWVAVLHDDGTYDPPVVREDLSRSQQAILFQYTVQQYVRARENYSWEGINANYKRASAMSAPAERARYQGVMLDRKHPENPAVLYGDGLNAAITDVGNIVVRLDPNSPNAVSVSFVLKITPPNLPPRTLRKTAVMTWMDARDQIPADVQQQYDPAGIAFTHYSSNPDPDAAR